MVMGNQALDHQTGGSQVGLILKWQLVSVAFPAFISVRPYLCLHRKRHTSGSEEFILPSKLI